MPDMIKCFLEVDEIMQELFLVLRMLFCQHINTLNFSICSDDKLAFKLHKSYVLSMLLFGCESWMLAADLRRRTQVFCKQTLQEDAWHVVQGTENK